MFKKSIIFLILVFFLLAGCSKVEEVSGVPDLEGELTEDAPDEEEIVDYEAIKANEAGEIMVIMYHSIGEEEKEFTRTPENFKSDLQKLYDLGYRPISLEDYAKGNINTEAGLSPVVITFDDGNLNNFNIFEKEDGSFEIDPNCAVAILEDFHKEHPDFPLEATFFLNSGIPFKQKEYAQYKLEYILERGMDIGNHTATHVNFKKTVSSDEIEKEIMGVIDSLQEYIPEYTINTLSLPFGSRPKDDSLNAYIAKGSENQYENIAIVEVGWDPYKSPYHVDFNPEAIHRVRGSDLQEYVKGTGLDDWIGRLEAGTRVKFISDGSPDKVVVPEEYQNKIDMNKIGERELITYSSTPDTPDEKID